ncbi:MAG: deoxyguanosinetriphosphate triphosphohydrolase, partial [Betaproteobacteria bacterium]
MPGFARASASKGAPGFQPTGAHLAAYASWPERSRGRRVAEAGAPDRNAFQRDRDRIVHST